MMKGGLVVVAISLWLTACATNRSATLTAPIDVTAAKAQVTAGPNSLRGSALIRQNGGGVVTCAGGPVTLMPVSPRAIQWAVEVFETTNGGFRSAGGRGVVFDPADPMWQAVKITNCDAQGSFKFDNLGDGDFYVFTRITWRVGYDLQGGIIMRPVRLSGGTTAEVVLSPTGV